MNLEEIKPGYGCVFTVTDYDDGPRKGIANFQDAPHFYECVFDEAKDHYTDLFRLTLLNAVQRQTSMPFSAGGADEAFRLVLGRLIATRGHAIRLAS